LSNGSGSSERRGRSEPKYWLNFDDLTYCCNVESFDAFVEQYLSERGLFCKSGRRTYWALFHAWKEGVDHHAINARFIDQFGK
jgi:hypothetical protein